MNIYQYFQNFSNNVNVEHYSRKSSTGAAFAERFYCTTRDLLKRPVLEKGDSNCIDVPSVIKKQYNFRVHTSSKLTPIQDASKKNEGCVYKNLLDK